MENWTFEKALQEIMEEKYGPGFKISDVKVISIRNLGDIPLEERRLGFVIDEVIDEK